MKKVDIILKAFWDGHDLEDLIRRVGMVIPPTVKDRNKYFLVNLSNYENVLTRDPTTVKILKSSEIPTLAITDLPLLEFYLSNYTDTELFRLFGFYVVYNSRKSLIDNLLNGMYGNGYFIPFDELSTELTIRYGCKSGESVIVNESHMRKKNISLLKNLKLLVSMYQNLPGAKELSVIVDKVISDKISYQTKLWPACKKWLTFGY